MNLKICRCFEMVLNNTNSKYTKNWIDNHKKLINSIDKSVKNEFIKTIDKAGLLEVV